MPIYQAYNRRINSWVKYKMTKGTKGRKILKIMEVKKRESNVPFKNVPVRHKKE